MEKRRTINVARRAEDGMSNDQQNAARHRVDDRVSHPENPQQSEVLFHPANRGSAQNNIATLAADCLVWSKRIAAKIAVHVYFSSGITCYDFARRREYAIFAAKVPKLSFRAVSVLSRESNSALGYCVASR